MTKEELITIIQNELKVNPKVTCLEIAKKHKVPVNIAEGFRRRLVKAERD